MKRGKRGEKEEITKEVRPIQRRLITASKPVDMFFISINKFVIWFIMEFNPALVRSSLMKSLPFDGRRMEESCC